ncbi:hypothetical protein [Tenacibaculum salmonis]|uniref:hypothetical protein n=1 Tax=Tenacibaculum sp. P3-BQ1 TaxID=3232310 RepID=UPI0034DFD57C
MKKLKLIIILCLFGANIYAQGENEDASFNNTTDLVIKSTNIKHNTDLEQLVFTIEVQGNAVATTPNAFGKMDGAPVLGYVFPTNLNPTDVGFNNTEGIVAMALTSHPDFDDTPLWDENNDTNYQNDGIVWHPHWVILTQNSNVAGGLAVKQFNSDDTSVILPPTNPGMPMYMDSPGYSVIAKQNTIKVIIPAYRINNKTNFNFDAVIAYMQVNTSDENLPLLGVYKVYSIASGDLSLPYKVTK